MTCVGALSAPLALLAFPVWVIALQPSGLLRTPTFPLASCGPLDQDRGCAVDTNGAGLLLNLANGARSATPCQLPPHESISAFVAHAEADSDRRPVPSVPSTKEHCVGLLHHSCTCSDALLLGCKFRRLLGSRLCAAAGKGGDEKEGCLVCVVVRACRDPAQGRGRKRYAATTALWS